MLQHYKHRVPAIDLRPPVPVAEVEFQLSFRKMRRSELLLVSSGDGLFFKVIHRLREQEQFTNLSQNNNLPIAFERTDLMRNPKLPTGMEHCPLAILSAAPACGSHVKEFHFGKRFRIH